MYINKDILELKLILVNHLILMTHMSSQLLAHI